MLRFSANLSMLFGEYDFLARFEKAAQCGFRGVEFMFPYDYDIEELKQIAEDIAGVPNKIQTGDKVVAKVLYRDGTLLDTIKNVL